MLCDKDTLIYVDCDLLLQIFDHHSVSHVEYEDRIDINLNLTCISQSIVARWGLSLVNNLDVDIALITFR